MQLVIEILVIMIGFVVMYWKQRLEGEHRMTKMETMVKNLHEDHKRLAGKVDGISRSLGEVRGELKRVNGRKDK